NLARHLGALGAAAARVANPGAEPAAQGYRPAFLLDLLRGAGGPSRGSGRSLLFRPTISRGAGSDQPAMQPHPQRVPRGCVGADEGTEPVAQEVSHVVASLPRCLVAEQEAHKRLDGNNSDQAGLVAKPLVHETTQPLEPGTSIGVQASPRLTQDRYRI